MNALSPTGARYIVGLGANLGSSRATLRAATARIASHESVFAMRESRVTRTPPVGPAQPDYLNAAASFYADLSPTSFLAWLQQIERELGRDRNREARFGPRTLDLDLLHASTGDLATPSLTVPHPRLTERAFALLPLLEVAPELDATYGRAARRLVDDRAPLNLIGVTCARTDAHMKITAEGLARDRLDVIASAINALVSNRQITARYVHAPIAIQFGSLGDDLGGDLAGVLSDRPADISHVTLLTSPMGQTSLCWVGSTEEPSGPRSETCQIKLTETASDGRVRVDLSATT